MKDIEHKKTPKRKRLNRKSEKIQKVTPEILDIEREVKKQTPAKIR